MYRLVFENYLDHLMRHRGAARRQGALWYPDRGTAEQAAARMRALGQAVSIEVLGQAPGGSRVAGTGGAPALGNDGPLITPVDF